MPAALAQTENTSPQIGAIPYWLLAALVPAAGGAIAGAVVAQRKVLGALVGAGGGAIGGITATLILRALSK